MPRRRVASPTRRSPARVTDVTSKYARDVLGGRILAGPYVRLACRRHLQDIADQKTSGLRWDTKEASRAIRFCPEILTLGDGRPFKLEPFEQFIGGSLFGWRNADGSRRFKTAYVEIGKGNGKTPFAGGIGTLALVADGEPSPEVYFAATMQDQASIGFKDAKGMVERSDELRNVV